MKYQSFGFFGALRGGNGSFDGIAEGAVDGVLLGEAEGAVVGMTLGDELGAELGLIDGIGDGAVVVGICSTIEGLAAGAFDPPGRDASSDSICSFASRYANPEWSGTLKSCTISKLFQERAKQLFVNRINMHFTAASNAFILSSLFIPKVILSLSILRAEQL